jgi:hypothetical protein
VTPEKPQKGRKRTEGQEKRCLALKEVSPCQEDTGAGKKI